MISPGLDQVNWALVTAIWILSRIIHGELDSCLSFLLLRIGANPHKHFGVKIEHHHIVVDQIRLRVVEDLFCIECSRFARQQVEQTSIAGFILTNMQVSTSYSPINLADLENQHQGTRIWRICSNLP